MPDGYEAVSGIYHISFSEELPKPVKIWMQHCVDLGSDEDSKQLSFAKASNYKFELVPGGHFPVGERHGCIARDKFCCFAILRTLKDYIFHNGWYFCLYYWTSDDKQIVHHSQKWTLHITVGRDLVFLYENCAKNEEPVSFNFKFSDSYSARCMELNLPKKLTNLNGWRIKANPWPCQILQDQADLFGFTLCRPAECILEVNAHLSPSTPKELDYEIPIKGVTDCPTSAIHISRTCPDLANQAIALHCTDDTALSSVPNLVDDKTLSVKDLVNVLGAVIEITDWFSLGLVLGLYVYELENIRQDANNQRDRLTSMLSLWLKRGTASWKNLVQALLHPLVNKRDIAQRIREQHPLKQ